MRTPQKRRAAAAKSGRVLSVQRARSERLSSEGDLMEYERMYIRAIVAYMVLDMRKRARLSQAQLARRARLKPSALKALEDARDRLDPTIHDILRVAVACGFELSAVISRPQSRAAPECYTLRPGGL